ncbi:hypothetical protein NDK43_20415 [Neobacillus pocheonensis]|uniref:Uncharacterized protein n=1 Tax=Neobacillus pocheonensis TaxID=363869 RepID=A0ABT0WD88_9BACI|nr:hypothetical protein [Neobacillus pocheonensis]
MDGRLKNGSFNLDRFIDVYGLIPTWFNEGVFRAINAPISYSPYVNLIKNADNKRFVEKWHLMDSWLQDQVPFTGGVFRQLVNDFIKENKLMKGSFTVHGKKVDLENITANLLVISSKNDNLVLEEQSRPMMDLVSSEDKTFLVVEAGHTSLAFSGKMGTLADQWLCSRS